jgi:hypothetical protein
MDANEEISSDNIPEDLPAREMASESMSEESRRAARADARSVGTAKARNLLLKQENDALRAELDSYREQTQSDMDKLRDLLFSKSQLFDETEKALHKSRIRSDECQERLEAEKETVARLQHKILNLERNARGVIQTRFDESGYLGDEVEVESPPETGSHGRKRRHETENLDDDGSVIESSETSFSNEGKMGTMNFGQGLRLAIAPGNIRQPHLTDTSYRSIKAYQDEIFQSNSYNMASTRPNDRTKELKNKALAHVIDDQFNAPSNVSKIGADIAKLWKDRLQVSDERFLVALKQVFGSGTDQVASNSYEGLRLAINELKFEWDPRNQSSLTTPLVRLREIEEDALGGAGITPENHRSLVNEFINILKARNPVSKNPYLFETARRLRQAYEAKAINTLGDLAKWLSVDGAKANKTAAEAQEMGLYHTTDKVGGGSGRDPHSEHQNSGKGNQHGNRPGKDGNPKRKSDFPSKPAKAKPKDGEASEQCWGCGRDNHSADNCRLKHHPDYNKESKPWDQSTSGKAYAAMSPEPLLTLPFGRCLHPLSSAGAAFLQANEAKNAASAKGRGGKKKGNEPTQAHLLFLTHRAESVYSLAARTLLTDDSLLPVSITHANHSITHHRALVDTGALHGDYISREMAQTLREQGATGIPCRQRIISALNSSQLATEKFSIIVTIFNEVSNHDENLLLEATVIDIDYEIVIGRPTIKINNLIDKVRKHLVCNTQHTIVAKLSATQRLANLLIVEPASKFLDPLETSDGLPIRDDEPPWQRAVNGESSPTGLPENVAGSPDEVARQCAFLATYPDIFSAELQPEPANIEPMELKVNIEKWESMRANQAPPRQQSMQKNAEIFRQITAMKAQGVIQESKARHWSQVLLTPKPNGKWRFCIDYINANEASDREGWPLPHIELMLRRIGEQRPKYFAVMDYTSGYYQAPLRPS